MSKNVVFLDDPNDELYGELSPEFKINLVIKDKIKEERSNNIVSYTYAGLLPKGSYHDEILKMSPKQAQLNAISYLKESQYKIFQNAFADVYKMFVLNPIPLLKTAQETLLYRQMDMDQKYDMILGVDSNNVGENLVGKGMMKLRSEIRGRVMKVCEDDSQNDYNYLVTVRDVYKHLRDKISNGLDSLEKYVKRSPFDIANELKLSITYIRDPLPEIVQSVLIELEPFIKECRANHQEEADNLVLLVRANSYNIAAILRREFEQTFNETRVGRNKVSILQSFVASMAGNLEELAQYLGREEAIYELMDRLYELYQINPQMISNPMIDMTLIESSNNGGMFYRSREYREQLKQAAYTQQSTDARIITSNDLFTSIGQVIQMDDMVYPHPIHYCYSKMIEKLNTSSLEKHNKVSIHRMILKNRNGNVYDISNYKSVKEVSSLYERLLKDHIMYTLEDRLDKGLRHKFQNQTYLKLLVGTGNKRLIYNTIDPFLGTGPLKYDTMSFKGRNMAGVIMERIRRESMDEVDPLVREKPGAKAEITSDEIFKDVFGQKEDIQSIKKWMFDQMMEISNLIVNLKLYQKEKYKINNQNVLLDEISFIIQHIYSVCHILEKLVDMDQLKSLIQKGLPTDVKDLLTGSFESHKLRISDSMMKKIWSYILVLILSVKLDGRFVMDTFDLHIYDLAKKKFKTTVCTQNNIFNIHEEKEDQKIKQYIQPEIIKEMEFKNCIAQAMVNLVEQLKVYHIQNIKNKETSYTLEKIDLEYIYSIMSYYAGRELLNRSKDFKANTSEILKIVQLLERNKISFENQSVVEKFSEYMNALSKGSSDTKYRVIYFANENDTLKEVNPKKKTKKAAEEEKAYKEWLEKRLKKSKIEVAPENLQVLPVEPRRSFKQPVKKGMLNRSNMIV